MFSRGTWSSKLSVETLVRLLDDVFSRFDNGSRSDAIVVNEFVRFSAMGNRPHCQLMNLDAFRTDRIEDSIAESPMCIVVFNRKDPVFGTPGALQQRGAIDGNDAVEIDHPYRDPCRFQMIVGFEGFEECDACRDDGQSIGGALSQDLGSTDLESLVRSIEYGRFWSAGSDIDHAFVVGGGFYQAIGACAVRWV